MRLPTKKTFPVILACVIAVGAVVFAATYSIDAKKTSDTDATLTAVQSYSLENNLREIDTDNDGLKDWEEALWKSDPRTEDSDKDGILDGAEIAAGRNPTIKGPQDKITAQQQAAIVTKTPEVSSTQTGIIARELFANYVELKKSGKNITPEMENQIIQNTLLAAEYGQSGATLYTTKNIAITNDISTASLKKYANAMGAVFRINNPRVEENELVIMSRVMVSRSASDLARLDVLITAYKKIVDASLKVTVPQSLVPLHLEFVNSFSMGLDADIQMRKLFDDAASALIGLKQYEEAATNISNTHEKIFNYYADQSILFNENEDGYGFLHMIAH